MATRRGRVLVAALVGMSAAIAIGAATPGRAEIEVRLTAAGDYGARASSASVMREIASISPDAHLALGDLAYGDSPNESAWCAFVKQHVGEGFPFQLVAGNHESLDNPDGAINNFSACLPNQIPGIVGTYGREYYMDFPTGAPLVRVIQTSPFLTFSDGRWNYGLNDAHYTWLANAIDDGRARGARWIVVTSHYPCLTMGANGCSQPEDFYDLLVAKRVDLVLHGHDHSYARTHQLRSGVPGCPRVPARTFNAACVADTDGDFTAGNGSVFATVGTGGINLRDVNPSDSETGYFAAWSGQNSNATYGLLDMSVTEDVLEARFVRASGGDFTDSFTITRAPTTPVTTTAPPATTTTTVPPPTTVPPTTLPPATTTTTTTTTTTSVPTVPGITAGDAFGRTTASGWGTADTGGPWTVSPPSAFSVDGSAGRITIPTGASRTAHLRNVDATDTDVLVVLSNDKVATGSGLYISVVPRAVAGVGEYRAVLRTRADGQLTLRIDRGATTISPEIVVPAIRYTPGAALNVRASATGTSPTTLRVKVWESGTAEPANWQVSTTDSAATMQAAGSVGFYVYLSSSATNGPITMAVDELVVRSP